MHLLALGGVHGEEANESGEEKGLCWFGELRRLKTIMFTKTSGCRQMVKSSHAVKNVPCRELDRHTVAVYGDRDNILGYLQGMLPSPPHIQHCQQMFIGTLGNPNVPSAVTAIPINSMGWDGTV